MTTLKQVFSPVHILQISCFHVNSGYSYIVGAYVCTQKLLEKGEKRSNICEDIFSAIKKKTVGTPGWLSRLSVRLLVFAQVMASQFVSLSPALGSILTAQSLLGILSLSLSLCTPPKINKHLKTYTVKLKVHCTEFKF